MTTYCFTAKFTDTRYCTIEAEDMDEAELKFQSGEWEAEDTIDFVLEEIVKPLEPEIEQ